MQPRKLAIFLMGPTASGKTNLAIKLADILPIDIISVDSAMIYRGMNVGTGKPSNQQLVKTPHALVDILSPTERYSVDRFCNDAFAQMELSVHRGRIPMLVGGAMMYFKGLQFGMSPLPGSDEVIRNKIVNDALNYGWGELHKRLKQLDPKAAVQIHQNDQQRVQRALEIIYLTGKSLTELKKRKYHKLFGWTLKTVAIAPRDRSLLHQRISKRFEQMLLSGFEEEVCQLQKKHDLHLGLPSVRSVGYRQIWQFLHNQLSKSEMVAKSVATTRQLAKRQFTWLNHWPNLHWLDSDDVNISCKFEKIVNVF